ncbi:MAG: hypothetical protein KC483_11335 [Nitrosarchaeum sp.]|nr:hypothetical protein [Nitrosarchaeum sp.]
MHKQQYGIELGNIGIPTTEMGKDRKSIQTKQSRIRGYLELALGSILGAVIIVQLLGVLF